MEKYIFGTYDMKIGERYAWR